jgi:drug/metabolite transporter (DMT)-like permease
MVHAVSGIHVAALMIPALWGLYWVPLRALDSVAASGPWATLAAVAVALVVTAPSAWRERARIRATHRGALVSTLLGGVSFVLYSNGILYGHVATVILLFYLTPIWSLLLTRIWFGWPASGWRYAAIAMGLGGIMLVLAGGEGGVPLPTGMGDWFGLLSGLLWAVSSTGLRTSVRTGGAATNFVFCAGGALGALVIAAALGGAPPPVPAGAWLEAAAWLALLGVGWWGISLAVFMWAAQRIDPTRLGILMMTEAIVGTLSAALFTSEPFGWQIGAGAVLVVGAAVLEARHDPLAGGAGA